MLDFIHIPSNAELLGAAITYYIVNYCVFHSPLRECWIDYAHFTEKDLEDNEDDYRVQKYLAIAFSVLLTSTVLSSLLVAFEIHCWCGAVTLAFYVWLGFVATNLLNTFLWEPTKFYVLCINWGYRLLSIVAQALVLNCLRQHKW